MTLPLWGLVGLAILVLVQVSADSFLLKASVGNAWTVGARDEARKVSPVSGRATRALRNLLETAPAFIALALVAELSGRGGAWVAWGVYLYLGGRALHFPAYLSGVPWLRTIFWQIATLGIVLMLIGLFATSPLSDAG